MSGFPVRCFTCGKVVGAYEKKYNELKEKKVKIDMKVFEGMGITRYCCIRMFMGYVELDIYPKEEEKGDCIQKKDNKNK